MGFLLLPSVVSIFVLMKIHSVYGNMVLEVSKLLRSKPISQYQSVDTFAQAVNDFSTKYQRSQTTQSIPWMIKFAQSCDHACHHKTRLSFGEYRYQWFHTSYAIISAKAAELETFRSTHPNTITDYIPFHPDMKIHSELRVFDKTTSHCDHYRTTQSPSEVMTVHFTAHHMSPADHQTLVENFRKLEMKYDQKVSITLPYPEEPSLLYGLAHISDCSLTMEIVKALAHRREVVWLERQYPIVPNNRWAKGTCDTGDIAYTPLNDHNITGHGEVVGVSDTGIDMMNCYFYDPNVPTPYQLDTDTSSKVNMKHRKVVLYMYQSTTDKAESAEGHGTHVSASVAGLAYKSYGDYAKFNGMSSDAKIAFFDINKGAKDNLVTPSDLNNGLFLKLHNAAGVKIFTNSWGSKASSNNSPYTSQSAQIDQFLWNHPDTMVLFSAGNDGALSNTNGGSLSTINAQATCKNCITVGAASSDHQAWEGLAGSSSADSQLNKNGVAYFSSCGPTNDLRLKPDILAPGFFVFSAKGYNNASSYHCDIQGMSGTSMSSPILAGHAVKVRQYYLQGFYPTGQKVSADGFTPSGALIKATLIHSGQAMSAIIKADNSGSFQNAITISNYPSVSQGYGRVQLNEVLHFGKASRNPITMFVIGDTNTHSNHYAEVKIKGESHKYNFTTSSASTQAAIRITFCYTDYPGSVSSTVNGNLVNDLTVVATDSKGKTYSAYLASGTVKSNVQMIDIPTPTANTRYFVTITANTITYSPQPYALVITGQLSYLNATAKPETFQVYKTSSDTISQYTTIWIVIFSLLCAFLSAMLVSLYFWNRQMDHLEFGDEKAEAKKLKSSIAKKGKK